MRQTAATALLELYSVPENVSPLHTFTERFSTRYAELIYDVDEIVAVKGVRMTSRQTSCFCDVTSPAPLTQPGRYRLQPCACEFVCPSVISGTSLHALLKHLRGRNHTQYAEVWHCCADPADDHAGQAAGGSRSSGALLVQDVHSFRLCEDVFSSPIWTLLDVCVRVFQLSSGPHA